MNKLNLFVPITKIDAEKREVWGVLAEERVDKVGEIFDYEGSKPHFQKWSDAFAKATGGKSVGNLRAMHGKSAAGKFISVDFNDAEKRIEVGAKVVDPIDWEKCDEGVYTGFSIGGNVLSRKKDGDFVRYVAEPVEGSLVDNPCMYGALFTAVKAIGLEEQRKFRGGIRQVWACGVDPRHSHEEKAEAVSCLSKLAGGALRKDLYTVADLCALLYVLNSCRLSTKWEAEYEQDGSAIPGLLAQEVRDLTEIVIQALEEEAGELLNDLNRDKVAAMAPAEYQKFLEDLSARFSGVQLKDARAIVERALTSIPKPEDEMDKEEIQKLASAAVEKVVETAVEKAVTAKLAELDFAGVQKTVGETKANQEEIGKQIEDLNGSVKELTKAVADAVRNMPAPAKGVAKVVTKAEDNAEKTETDVSKLSGEEKTLHLIKEARKTPIAAQA